MKIEIDTIRKTITLKESVKFKELHDFLREILKEDIDNYSILGESVIISSNPIREKEIIYIQPHVNPLPVYPTSPSIPTYPNYPTIC